MLAQPSAAELHKPPQQEASLMRPSIQDIPTGAQGHHRGDGIWLLSILRF